VSGILLDMQEKGSVKTKLARSGGRIIYEKGAAPLSTRLPPAVRKELKKRAAGAMLTGDPPSGKFVGFALVGVTSGAKGYGFGGSAASIDHKLGNKGETWHVAETKPMDAVQALVGGTARLLFFIGVGLSGVLAIAALFLGRRMSRPIRRMADATRDIGKGQFDKRLAIRSRDELGDLARSFDLMAAELQRTTASKKELEREVAEREAAQAALQEALAEKEVLLREVHHRVKNNMQVIISLLRMHSRKTSDPGQAQVFSDCRVRIEAMSLIHEALYQAEDLSRIDFAAYIKKLCRTLGQAHDASGKGITLTAERCDARMNLDKGIAVGMVIAELISNAFKHAFPSGRGGGVSVRLTGLDAETMELIIADDGVGLPADIDLENPPSLGLRLVAGIVTRELGGSMHAERDGGTRFVIRFNCKRE
jgi:two-component sensor histidine kinase/HAMP domain-containing protein